MPYAQMIARAWQIVAETPKLKWFIWVPSFIAVLIFTGKITWQAYSYALENQVIQTGLDTEVLQNFLTILTEKNLLGWTLLIGFLVLIFYFLIPAWIDSVLISSLKKKLEDPEKYFSLRERVIDGGRYFLKIFELQATLAAFSPLSAIFIGSFLYRYLEDDRASYFIPILVIYFVVSLVINFFTSLAEYFVICDEERVSQSILKSINLVGQNLSQTVSIMLLLALINVRIIINGLVVLGVPLGIVFALTFVNSTPIIAIVILLGIIAAALAAYLSAMITIFSRGVWIQTFYQLKARQATMKRA